MSLRPASLMPEPSNGWVRRRPGKWNVGPELWCDLGDRSLGTPGREHDLEPLPSPSGGTLYVPPVRRDLREPLDRQVEDWTAQGGTALVQRMTGDPERLDPHVAQVWDLTSDLLRGDLDGLHRLPEGSVAVWPLIAGMTDDEESWRLGFDILKTAGASAVTGVVLELEGRQRRSLIEKVGGGFGTVFHGPSPSSRRFARAAIETGLAPCGPRPTYGSPRRQRNQQGAEVLILAGEALAGDDVAAHGLFRAARWVEECEADVQAMSLEGNLTIVEEIDARALAVLDDWSRNPEASRLRWLREYASGTEETR